MALKMVLPLIFIIIIVNNEAVHGQNSSVITYSTPQVYTVGLLLLHYHQPTPVEPFTLQIMVHLQILFPIPHHSALR